MDTKEEVLDSILRSIRTELKEFLELESKITCPIEYESRVIEMSRNFGRSVIEQSQGKLPKSRNQKKK
jgi:hypothetical protein